MDESTFLVGLLTADLPASLWLAPGFLLRAPEISGAGTGKGLLVRSICAIAFGEQPRAFTRGGDRQELDKRLASELIEAAPILFLMTQRYDAAIRYAGFGTDRATGPCTCAGSNADGRSVSTEASVSDRYRESS